MYVVDHIDIIDMPPPLLLRGGGIESEGTRSVYNTIINIISILIVTTTAITIIGSSMLS